MKNRYLIFTLLLAMMGSSCAYEPADLILINADVYTVDTNQPWAKAIVIRDNKIIGVFQSDAKALKHKRDHSRIVDLHGAFVLPGFIDAHVHFNRAGELINDANLMSVSDEARLRNELSRVTSILKPGEWITGGLWGAYEKSNDRWLPNRGMFDDLTKDYPCLLNNFDYTLYLANTKALQLANLEHQLLDGMILKGGKPTGLIQRGSPAIEKIREVMSPKSKDRLLEENRAALKALAAAGITEIHDIAVPNQTQRFIELEEMGELTCRVWLRPDLSRGKEFLEKELTMGDHPVTSQPDDYLRYGALKGYIDGIMGTHGALFYEPYDDQPNNFGHYRNHTSDDPRLVEGNMEKMYGLLKDGVAAGFVANVHAIGDKGVGLMLDTYERLMKDLGTTLEGYRVIHAQVISPEDFVRFNQLHVIAEVNPYHISDDMRWMEERIGYDRCKGAYAFKSLADNGAILSFGSDWPGTSAAEYYMHPRYLLHAAVNRTTLEGEPLGGWFPEQKISIEEAIKAYTINNAYAAIDQDKRGSITKGKLADLAICNLNLLKIDPEKILDLDILMTIVNGRVVFERGVTE